jgi:hypothetical protein
VTRRQKAIAFFVVLCVILVAAAISLNIGWIIANTGRITPIVFGMILFGLIIAGLIIYTVFLVLEIKRNRGARQLHQRGHPRAEDAHRVDPSVSRDAAVARCERRATQEFYEIMLADASRLHHTVDQVLKAGQVREKHKAVARGPVDMTALATEMRRARPRAAPSPAGGDRASGRRTRADGER